MVQGTDNYIRMMFLITVLGWEMSCLAGVSTLPGAFLFFLRIPLTVRKHAQTQP